MKILYAALKYDYGDPQRGFGFEHYNFYDSLQKMDGGMHEVVYFPFDEILLEVGRDRMNELLLKAVYREKPDLCFFVLFADEIKKETISEITKTGFLTFNWFADDHWRFDNFSKYYAPFFSWVSTTDSKAPEKYKKIGYVNVIKTQWACNHFLYKPSNSGKRYGVTFVGQPHGDRGKIIKLIEAQGAEVMCWGNGWPRGRVSQEKMIEIFSRSKINLNLTKSSRATSFKSFLSVFLKRNHNRVIKVTLPSRWTDNIKSLAGKLREQIKGRNFEIPGCGGFLITGDADNLEEYYEDGKEVVIYKDFSDLFEKIIYYMKNDDERTKISQAGYERTLRDHTYEKRFNEIFKTVGLIT